MRCKSHRMESVWRPDAPKIHSQRVRPAYLSHSPAQGSMSMYKKTSPCVRGDKNGPRFHSTTSSARGIMTICGTKFPHGGRWLIFLLFLTHAVRKTNELRVFLSSASRWLRMGKNLKAQREAAHGNFGIYCDANCFCFMNVSQWQLNIWFVAAIQVLQPTGCCALQKTYTTCVQIWKI